MFAGSSRTFEQCLNMHIAATVAIRDHEDVVVNVMHNPFDSRVSHRVLGRIGQRHAEMLFPV